MKHIARINETSIKLNNLSEAIIKMNSQTEFLCLVGVSVALMGILLATKKEEKAEKNVGQSIFTRTITKRAIFQRCEYSVKHITSFKKVKRKCFFSV